MHYSRVSGTVLAEDLHQVGMSIPVVDNDRQVKLPGQIQVSAKKIFFLSLVRNELAVIVQTCLAYGNDPRIGLPEYSFEFRQAVCVCLIRAVGGEYPEPGTPNRYLWRL